MAGELTALIGIKTHVGGTLSGGRKGPTTKEICPCCAPPSVHQRHYNYWTHLKLSDDGQELKWFADHGSHLGDIALDAAKANLYIANGQSVLGYGGKSTRKLNSDGDILWSAASSFLPAGDGGCLAIASNGDAICQSTNLGAVSPQLVRRASADGSEVWRVTFNRSYISSVCLDSDDNIYVAHGSNAALIHKYTSGGTHVWETTIPSAPGRQPVIRGIATDGTQIYIAGSSLATGNPSVQAYTMSGTLVWSSGAAGIPNAIACMPNGDIICGGIPTNFPGFPLIVNSTYCLDSSGSLKWMVNHGTTVNGVCSDASSNVYTCGEKFNGVTTRKYDSSGVLQWSHDYTYGYLGWANSIVADDAGSIYVGGTWIQNSL